MSVTYYHCGDPTKTRRWAGSTLWLRTLCDISTNHGIHWTAPENYTSYPEKCLSPYEGTLMACPQCEAHTDFGLYILGTLP